MTYYYYDIFGYKVASMIELPASQLSRDALDTCIPDVTIELGQLEFIPKDEDCYFDIKFENAKTTFYVKNIGKYQVLDGKQIIIDIFEDVSHESVFLYLFGSAFGFLMHQNLSFPLHGSAVVVDDSCVVLVGHSGAGKSSLSSGFIKRGYKLLTDDVSRYESMDSRFQVFHSYPSQKLWQDAIEQFNIEDESKSRLIDRVDKYSVKMIDTFETKPQRLKGIIEIVPQEVDDVKLIKLSKTEALTSMIMHSYRFEFFNAIENVETKREHFKQVALLVKEIPIYRLFRPSKGFTVDEQVNLIIQTIGDISNE